LSNISKCGRYDLTPKEIMSEFSTETVKFFDLSYYIIGNYLNGIE
jgi:hypothetical protein